MIDSNEVLKFLVTGAREIITAGQEVEASIFIFPEEEPEKIFMLPVPEALLASPEGKNMLAMQMSNLATKAPIVALVLEAWVAEVDLTKPGHQRRLDQIRDEGVDNIADKREGVLFDIRELGRQSLYAARIDRSVSPAMLGGAEPLSKNPGDVGGRFVVTTVVH